MHKHLVVGLLAISASTAHADHHNKRVDDHYNIVEHCDITDRTASHDGEVGYDVSYRYQSGIYRTRLPYNPGLESK